MNIAKQSIVWVFSMALVVSCNQGIDPITEVAPGTDQEAPVVSINTPAPGGLVQMPSGSPMKVDLLAEDDIELASVVIKLDGNTVEEITTFTDYRRFAPVNGYTIEGVETGSHTLQVTATDLTGKSASTDVVEFTALVLGAFEAKYGEIFYMSFDGLLFEFVSQTQPTVVGSPGFADGKIGKAYAGDADAYLTFPLDDLEGDEISATFWYNVNSTPLRAGLLTVSAPSADGLLRNFGFRFFREGSATDQIFKLNAGNGTIDSWWDGGTTATLKVEEVDWVHIAFTLSATHGTIYFDGEPVSDADWTGPVSWDGCEELTIASGMPNFIGWEHFSDLSLIDELRIFDRALTQEEIQAMIEAEQ